MAAQILDGKQVAQSLQDKIRNRIQIRQAQGLRRPGLAVILIGNDPASEIYVRHKRRACSEVGIHSQAFDIAANSSQEKLLALIHQLNEDAHIDGILVQLPLPKQIDSQKIIEAIRPQKDVDGFHPYNIGRLVQRCPQLRPCTPYGIMSLLQHYHLEIRGLEATVVGASNIVGRPMSLELLMAGATVTTCHSNTQDLAKHIQQAELLVVGIGSPGIIKTEWIKPGAIVIDVGINRLDDGCLVGDVDFAAAKESASWITPVPGGVGPMTVATLLQNTLLAAELLD